MKTKDIIYMIYNENESSVTSMGIEFLDFIHALSAGPDHILLLASGYFGEDYHFGLRMEFVAHERLEDLYKENVYHYGDFCWVDFSGIHALDQLDPQEKAELLYLGHYKQPLHSPFFEKLNNRFAYLAHDDGWYNKIFYRNKLEYPEVMRHLFANRLKTYRRNVPPLSPEIGQTIASFAKEGILVEWSRMFKSRSRVEIPLHVIGEHLDFDDVYNHMERHKAKAKAHYALVYRRNQWMIEV